MAPINLEAINLYEDQLDREISPTKAFFAKIQDGLSDMATAGAVEQGHTIVYKDGSTRYFPGAIRSEFLAEQAGGGWARLAKMAKPAAVVTKKAPKKRGPKTDPNAPRNKTIREEADRLRAEGNEILSGGGGKERLIPTQGGHKTGRRPDIEYRTPDGQVRGTNVGKTKADGTPIKRELEALDDLNGPGGLPTDFLPYD